MKGLPGGSFNSLIAIDFARLIAAASLAAFIGYVFSGIGVPFWVISTRNVFSSCWSCCHCSSAARRSRGGSPPISWSRFRPCRSSLRTHTVGLTMRVWVCSVFIFCLRKSPRRWLGETTAGAITTKGGSSPPGGGRVEMQITPIGVDKSTLIVVFFRGW